MEIPSRKQQRAGERSYTGEIAVNLFAPPSFSGNLPHPPGIVRATFRKPGSTGAANAQGGPTKFTTHFARWYIVSVLPDLSAR
jgi:hypothetical protein